MWKLWAWNKAALLLDDGNGQYIAHQHVYVLFLLLSKVFASACGDFTCCIEDFFPQRVAFAILHAVKAHRLAEPSLCAHVWVHCVDLAAAWSVLWTLYTYTANAYRWKSTIEIEFSMRQQNDDGVDDGLSRLCVWGDLVVAVICTNRSGQYAAEAGDNRARRFPKLAWWVQEVPEWQSFSQEGGQVSLYLIGGTVLWNPRLMHVGPTIIVNVNSYILRVQRFDCISAARMTYVFVMIASLQYFLSCLVRAMTGNGVGQPAAWTCQSLVIRGQQHPGSVGL